MNTLLEAPTTPAVHLVDDDDGLRQALSRLLRLKGIPVKTYASAAEFLLHLDEVRRGCILLDVRMGGGPSGIDLHQSLIRNGVELPVIFMTGYGDVPMSVNAIKSGAFDFLVKPVKSEILLSAVDSAMAEERKKWEAGSRIRELRSRRDSLTPCESEICRLVVAGETNKQIASEVGCSERTVKAHRANVMTKMKVTSLADLVHLFNELAPATHI